MTISADARPEKRLFISLITRDISLVDALLDLVDNSINSAIIMAGADLTRPTDYIALLNREPGDNIPTVDIHVSPETVTISDTCGGISLDTAQNHVFRFGRPADDDDSDDDTLSVYGIGLKRAMFKLGNHIRMVSRHRSGGFELDMDVKAWERESQDVWTIPIEPLVVKPKEVLGTAITVDALHSDIHRRISDGRLIGDLQSRISRTYIYFLERVVRVRVNGSIILPIELNFGHNLASEIFTIGDVSCAVIAGVSVPKEKFYLAENAGWFIFCNGRAVTFADKAPLTGWGTFLPTFQPKHRPFLGLVFFTSESPEALPWTTTKSSVNQESTVWQHALRIMGSVGKQITSYLDSRYTDEGTQISTDELRDAAGASTSAFSAVAVDAKRFVAKRVKKDTTSIQFHVKISEINEVKDYLGGRAVSNGEVGRHTFDYFLENVVRE